MKYRLMLIFFLLWQTSLLAQTLNLSTPRSTLYTHLENLKPDHYHPEIAAQTVYGLTGKKAEDKALKLKYIYDAKGLIIDYATIPNDPDYTDSTHFTFPKHAYKPFPLRLPEIYLEKYGNKWYYSRQTVSQIDLIFNELYPYGVDFVSSVPPEFQTKFLGIAIWKWTGLILLLIGAYLLHVLAKKLLYWIFRFLKNHVVSERFKTVERINLRLLQFSDPISYLVSLAFLIKLLPSLFLPARFTAFIMSGLNVALLIFWVFVFLRLVDVIMSFYITRAEQSESKLDDQLVPILRNTLKVIVLSFGIFKLLILFGADPKTILAGVSIGGLAIGLASQDTIKNLIGTFMIFVDKPFRIGDWISFENVEGSVEEVGFRSSSIRAADTTIFKVPNSKLAEIVINNKGQRVYRRYQTQIGIRYDTPPHLVEAFVEGIKEIIEVHPLTRNSSDHTAYNMRPYNVEFIEYGDSALLIMVNVYFKTTDWGEEMHGRHVLHLGILELAEKLGVGFAFPSQTLYMELFPEKKPEYPEYPQDPAEIKKRIEEAVANFNAKISKY